jgi:hypothetical protein
MFVRQMHLTFKVLVMHGAYVFDVIYA